MIQRSSGSSLSKILSLKLYLELKLFPLCQHSCFDTKLDIHNKRESQKYQNKLFLRDLLKQKILSYRVGLLIFQVFRTSKCDFEFKNPSVIISRYFAQVFALILCPLILKFIFLVKGFRGALNNKILVLSVFKAILFALSHLAIFLRS